MKAWRVMVVGSGAAGNRKLLSIVDSVGAMTDDSTRVAGGQKRCTEVAHTRNLKNEFELDLG